MSVQFLGERVIRPSAESRQLDDAIPLQHGPIPSRASSAFTQQVVDTVGAGDAFLSVTSPLAAIGVDIETLGLIGNAVGALKVGIVGHRNSVEKVPLMKYLTALLKLSQFGNATVIPTTKIVDGLRKHLSNRTVEFKISCQQTEAALKGTITLVQADFENGRRLLLEAEFKNVSERNLENVERLARFIVGQEGA